MLKCAKLIGIQVALLKKVRIKASGVRSLLHCELETPDSPKP
jgi:hypothetical protein